MKKQKQTTAQKAAPKKQKKPALNTAPATDRRNVLRYLRNAAIGIPLIGIGGYYSVHSIKASIREGDLGRIGNGRPAIVQIHDPGCRLCQTLQSQTRNVLSTYDDSTFEYLVAPIRSQEGSALAVKYGVQHVTLLLFDAKGKMVEIVRGPIPDASLKSILTAHMKRHG